MAQIDWLRAKEPGNADTLNRPLRQLLEAAGVDPDADFTGFGSELPVAASDVDRDALVPTPTDKSAVLRTDKKGFESHSTGTWKLAIQQPFLVKDITARLALSGLADGTPVITKDTGEVHIWDATNNALILAANRPEQVINAKAKGCLADGTGRTIGDYNILQGYPTTYRRPDWLGVYADDDTMDYAGAMEAEYAAFGPPGAQNSSGNPNKNYALYYPGGKYIFSRHFRINRVLSGRVYGDGRFATQFWMNRPNWPLLQINGFSSSMFIGIGLYSSVDNPEDKNSANPSFRKRGALFENDWDNMSAPATGLADTFVASATQNSFGPSTAVAWVPNQFAGMYVWFVAGAGSGGGPYGLGTYYKIKGNTNNRIIIDDTFDSGGMPDGTTKFVITGTPVLRSIETGPHAWGKSWARGEVVADTSGGGAVSTASTLGKSAYNSSTWAFRGPFMMDGYDGKFWLNGAHVGHYALLTRGTGAGQYRAITANTLQVASITPNWSIIPDGTSGYVLLAASPLGIDSNTPFTVDNTTITTAGLAVAGAPTWVLNQYQYQEMWVIEGTGKGQVYEVASNTVDGKIAVARPWDIPPDATSKIRIIARPFWSGGNQATLFSDMEVSCEGNDVGYGIRAAHHAQGTAKSQTSEMRYQNVFVQWFRSACYLSAGANALQNVFDNGNFQSYRKHAFWIQYGAFQAYSVGLQADFLGRPQIWNGGWDFNIINSAGDHSAAFECRSENIKCAFNSNYHDFELTGYGGSAFSPNQWGAGSQYYAGDIVYPTNAYPDTIKAKPMVCVYPGVAGGVEPNWTGLSNGEIITDNTVIWQVLRVQSLAGANINAEDCAFNIGQINLGFDSVVGSRLRRCTSSRYDCFDFAGVENDSLGLGEFAEVTVHLRGLVNDTNFATPYPLPGSVRKFKGAHYEGGGAAHIIGGGPAQNTFYPPIGWCRGNWDIAAGIFAIIGTVGCVDPVDISTGVPVVLANTKPETRAIAAGRSSGTAVTANPNDLTGDGHLHLQVSPPGAAGNTLNPLVDAVVIEYTDLYARHLGGMVMKTIAVGPVADGGNYTPDVGAATKFLILANGDILINAPVRAGGAIAVGTRLGLEIHNVNIGAKTPTFNAVFAMPAMPAIGVGKRVSLWFTWDGVFWGIDGGISANF